MKNMSLPARAYILGVIALGIVLTLAQRPSLPDTLDEWAVFGVLTLCASVAQLLPVVTPKHQAYYITLVFVFAGLLMLQPGLLALLVVLAFVPEWIKIRYRWYIQLFNMASFLVDSYAARFVYSSIAMPDDGGLGYLDELAAGILAAATFTLLNHFLVAMVLRLVRKQSWRESRLFEMENLLTDGTLSAMGMVAASLWQVSPWLILLVGAPLFLVYRGLNTPNLEEQARTDAKTGLYNARHFNQMVQEELHRAARFGRPVAVIMADMDHLRNINNSYGHLAGDVVIKGVAEIIQRSMREYDISARFGGEEFAVLLPETDGRQGLAVAERLRQQVEETCFAVSTSVDPIEVTISLGVASFPTDGWDAEEVIHQADLAAYYAKLRGRNRSWLASAESRALGPVMANRKQLETLMGETAAAESAAGPESDLPEEEFSDDVPAMAAPLPFPSERPAPPTIAEDEEAEEAGPEPSVLGPEAPALGRVPAGEEPRARHGRQRLDREAGVPLPVAALVASVVALSAALWIGFQPWNAHVYWPALALLAVLTGVAQTLALDIYGRGRVSTSAILILSGCFIFGMPGALLLSPVVPVAVWVRNRGQIHRALYDLGGTTLAAAASVGVYGWVIASLPSAHPLLLLIPAGLASVAYYAVNVGLVALAIGLSEKRSVVAVWQQQFRWLFVHYVVFGLMAAFMVLAYQAINLYGLLVFFLPPVMLRYVMKQYTERTEENVSELKRVNQEMARAHEEVVSTLQELRATYDATLKALSAALDSRDADTEGHSQRVVGYAAAISRRLELADVEIGGLLNGALLHDVGKIGVPDAILTKKGPLTPAEWVIMKRHPEIGYQMLRHIGFLDDALPVVRFHHERWDGTGYPHGLRGQEIPQAARIFAVADAFDAMTSDRPYRPARSFQAARDELARCAGTQFDATIVEAFLKVGTDELIELSGREEEEPLRLEPRPRILTIPHPALVASV